MRRQMTHDTLIPALDRLANTSLHLWPAPRDARARLINVSENATYLVEGKGWRSILRVHRQGYHSRAAIASELAWAEALRREGGIVTARVLPGRNGAPIQTGVVAGLPAARHMVMFEFLEGVAPEPDDDLEAPFEGLGAIAARAHLHTVAWSPPSPFERHSWNLETVFGQAPTWGDWRGGPGVSADIAGVLERVERTVTRRLTAFGRRPGRYGLIHADMRLANLLIHEGETRLIDFDDCGFGWLLYDFAAAISFMEDHPQVPVLKDAWLRGYRRIRPLAEEDAREIDSFVMLRRLALLAWIGLHSEVETARELSPSFARVSAELGEAYLSKFDSRAAA
jgi:Ser/Thr protein kinase RdoA (MazF antagonist)